MATGSSLFAVTEDDDLEELPLTSPEEKESVIVTPDYLLTDSGVAFKNISIKAYERKSTTTFPKEEYYAFEIITILDETGQSEERLEEEEEGSSKTTQLNSWDVWRRYSEFELLKSFLTAVYPYLIIPPISEKKLQGSSGIFSKITFGEDVEFLTQRQRALEIFLVRLMRHAVLRENVWFHRFLSQQSNWKEDMKETGYQAIMESKFKAISRAFGSQKPDSKFMDIQNYSIDLKAALESLVNIREKMVVFWNGMYYGYAHYGSELSQMIETEKELADALQKATGYFDSYAKSIDTFMEEEEVRYLLPLKEYIGFCDSLKLVVRKQEQLQGQYEKAEDAIFAKVDEKEKLEKQASEGGTGGGFSLKKMFKRGPEVPIEEKIAALETEMRELDIVCKEKRRNLKAFNQQALKDFEHFNTQKVADFRSVLVNFVQLQIQLHRKGLATWQKIKSSFQADSPN